MPRYDSSSNCPAIAQFSSGSSSKAMWGRIAIRPYITFDELPDKNGAIAGQLLDEA